MAGQAKRTTANHKDESLAGLRRQVAALKEEYGVETRFQLGYAMGSQGSESAPDN